MSDRKFIALGTASQVPTRTRNHNGYFLRLDAHGFLFDPGEGTQRQMIFADVSATEITKIFITHFHGDHCLGLAGILQRFSLDKVPHEVEIYYPKSGQKFFDNLKNASIYHNTAQIAEKPFDTEGVIFQDQNLTIETFRLEHGVESWGFRFVEADSVNISPEKLAATGLRGKSVGILKTFGEVTDEKGQTFYLKDLSEPKKGLKFAFVMDTKECSNCEKLAQDADFLVIESTYLHAEVKDAVKNGHLTAQQSAEIAVRANVKNLILTHFSQRYLKLEEFHKEAAAVHSKVFVLHDGDVIDLRKV